MRARYMGVARQTVLNHLNMHIPWPASREGINPAFIDDIAKKVAAATHANKKNSKAAIRSIINNEIKQHYEKAGSNGTYCKHRIDILS